MTGMTSVILSEAKNLWPQARSTGEKMLRSELSMT